MKAMKATMAGKKKRYMMSSNIGGIIGPITVEAAMSITMRITGPRMAMNM